MCSLAIINNVIASAVVDVLAVISLVVVSVAALEYVVY